MLAAGIEIARELGRMAAAWLAARPRIRALAIASAAAIAALVLWKVIAAILTAPAPLPLAAVTGSVTLDGRPVTGGIVRFAPDARGGSSGPAGEGIIDPNGRYRITTIRRPGAVVGKHRVAVVAIDDLDPSQSGGATRALPIIYARPDTSGLSCQVQANTENTFDITLISPPPKSIGSEGKKKGGSR